MPVRQDPPGLDALAAAVARYQAQLAEQRRPRTTKELAVRAGRAAGGPAIVVAIAVAISQLAQSILGGNVDPGNANTGESVAEHDSSATSHGSIRVEIAKLLEEVAQCKASAERMELAADAPIEPPPPRKGRRGPR